MIIGKFYNGSGLGNMLHRYIATRVLALDKGIEYGMIYIDDGAGKEEGFKGKFFIEQPRLVPHPINYTEWNEKKVVENGVDIRSYDPEFNFIEDGAIIDGEFQDPRYFEHRMDDIREWLKVEPINMPNSVCVIGFRGGEYSLYPDLFLGKEYWDKAIAMKRELNPNMGFEVHTDDPITARKFFPDFPITNEIGENWRSVRYAKHLIIANSSFYILPALLNENVKVIAPRYWARHNTGVWALPQNYYKQFFYI